MSEQLYRIRPLAWDEADGCHRARTTVGTWCRLTWCRGEVWRIVGSPHQEEWATLAEAKEWVESDYREMVTVHFEPVETSAGEGA